MAKHSESNEIEIAAFKELHPPEGATLGSPADGTLDLSALPKNARVEFENFATTQPVLEVKAANTAAFGEQVEKLVSEIQEHYALIHETKAKFTQTIATKQQSIIAVEELAEKEQRPPSELELKFKNWQLNEIERLRAEFLEKTGEERDFYYAIRGEGLRCYGKQLREGRIVRTPYVNDQLEKVLERLNRNEIVLLHGDTGGGKTECARIAAREYFGKEPLVVRGYPGMGQEELYGHLTLTADVTRKVSDVVDHIEANIAKWQHQNPDAKQEEKDEKKQLISQAILNENKVTVVEYVLGARYLAMKEGRVLIEDEANCIPPALRRKGNDLDTKQVGELVTIQEDGGAAFSVAKGYGKIETVNLGSRYGEGSSGRYKYTPDEMQRRSPVEFDYLPQAIKGGLSDVTDPAKKQLFMIALSALVDKEGNISAPKDVLEQVWNFCQFAATTQLAFSGRITDSDYQFQQNGVPVQIELDVLASPRMVQRILSAWKKDGFRYELDYYVADLLLAQAVEPHQRAYLFQLGESFGLFGSKGWPENPDYGENGEVAAFPLNAPKNREKEVQFTSFIEVVDALWGKAPPRTNWPKEIGGELDEASRIEFFEGVDSLDQMFARLEERITSARARKQRESTIAETTSEPPPGAKKQRKRRLKIASGRR